MKNVFLGEYVKQRLLDLGLTQEQLCDGICEPMTLSRLENGKQTPSRNRINALLQRLGLPDDRYFALLSKNELEMEALQKEIVACNVTEKVPEGFEKLAQFEKLADPDDQIAQQFALRSRVLLGRLDGRYTPLEQIDLLMQAIQLTVPRFDLESIESFLYTRDEITIINQIGLAYSDAGQNKKAAEIYYQLLKYVRKHFKERSKCLLLGIFLYNGTMFYELKNGTLVETKDAQGNFDLTQVLGNKYLEDVDSEKCVIVDTYSNRCFLISKDLLHHGVSEEVYHKMLDSDETDSNKSSEEVTFILTITYKCNMHCTYCYQQNDKTLEKKLISDETLDKILSIIAQYMEANPNKTVRLGLFGGEPLLIENEKVIDKILQFCKEHKTTVHITTNGSFLSYYLKKFIINRRFISGIYPTIDSMALNYMTRYDLDPSRNNTNETFKLLCCIKTLLHYGIHVDLGTNIDRHNHKEIWNTLDDLKKLQLLQDKNFAWTIGRVDDRLYETNFPDIMMESEILAELQSKPLPDNVHAAFLKTCYNFADKMGLKLNLREHKQTHSYCWSTSSSSNVFYVDMNLKTYRCTCTVGRSRYSLFDFSYENLTNYRPVAVTCNSYAECKDCKIGGFCGGGCQLSHQIDFKKCCTYEEEVFSHFMKTLFIPYIKSKYNEVNQNERKAENRCT